VANDSSNVQDSIIDLATVEVQKHARIVQVPQTEGMYGTANELQMHKLSYVQYA